VLRIQHSKTPTPKPTAFRPQLPARAALPRNVMSVNAKPLEQPVFQAGPSRCESGHGHHFQNSKFEIRNPKKKQNL
jgi:hypothetical protein